MVGLTFEGGEGDGWIRDDGFGEGATTATHQNYYETK
jgi:hypothetical protein